MMLNEKLAAMADELAKAAEQSGGSAVVLIHAINEDGRGFYNAVAHGDNDDLINSTAHLLADQQSDGLYKIVKAGVTVAEVFKTGQN